MNQPLTEASGCSAPGVENFAELDLEQLTRLMKKGDEMAYRTFYDAYYDRLWRYLLVVTSGDEDATTEALQGALVRVVRYIKVFSNEPQFWGWLTVLARSALSDQRRGRKRYLAFLDRFTRHSEVEHAPGAGTHTETKLVSLLEHNLEALPVEERQLLEAKYFNGRSVREIAQTFATSEKAIESRLSRVRRKLKGLLLEGIQSE